MFNYYRHLIAAKQNNPALANGKYATAINDNDKVFSFYRKYKNKEVLVAVNLCGDVQMANFEQGHKKYTPLFGNSKMQNKAVDLDPYQVVVFEVK